MNIKELKDIIKDLDDDMEVIVKDSEEDVNYDSWSLVINIDGNEYLQVLREPDTTEDTMSLEILERFNRDNIQYSLDVDTGEFNYTSAEEKEKGEEIIKEIEKEFFVS